MLSRCRFNGGVDASPWEYESGLHCHLSELQLVDRPLAVRVGGKGEVILAQEPRPRPGLMLKGLQGDVENLWSQILVAQPAGVPALAVMGCRKMLNHVAESASLLDVAHEDVEDEPQEFRRFTAAEKYLEAHHWLPKGVMKLGEKIRKKGDEVNHLGALPDTKEAQETIGFTETAPRFLYTEQEDTYDEEALRDKIVALKQRLDDVLTENADA